MSRLAPQNRERERRGQESNLRLPGFQTTRPSYRCSTPPGGRGHQSVPQYLYADVPSGLGTPTLRRLSPLGCGGFPFRNPLQLDGGHPRRVHQERRRSGNRQRSRLVTGCAASMGNSGQAGISTVCRTGFPRKPPDSRSATGRRTVESARESKHRASVSGDSG